jgi:hypothetical protein
MHSTHQRTALRHGSVAQSQKQRALVRRDQWPEAAVMPRAQTNKRQRHLRAHSASVYTPTRMAHRDYTRTAEKRSVKSRAVCVLFAVQL